MKFCPSFGNGSGIVRLPLAFPLKRSKWENNRLRLSRLSATPPFSSPVPGLSVADSVHARCIHTARGTRSTANTFLSPFPTDHVQH